MIEINEIFPLFVVDKLETLKEFYSAHFGFTAVYFEPDFYLHLLHSSSGHQIGFLLPNHPTQPEFLQVATNKGGSVISFDVANAKHAWNIAQDAGLDVVLPYTEEAWGQNHFIIRDPEGNYVDIVEHVEK